MIGDLYICKVPYVNKRGAKIRPVVIISKPNSKGDFFAVAGSSKIHQWENENNNMRDTFWIGVYPGMTKKKIEFIIQKIRDFVREM